LRRAAAVRTLPFMETTDLKRFVQFSPDVIMRSSVFETGNLWSEVLCFDRNQVLGPMRDRDSDGIFTILAGEAVFVVDRKRRRLQQWASVLVPADSEVTVTNASPDPLVLLLVVSPPPVPHSVNG
jgi:quercetin dioxygenase-like cupin family protein